MPGIDDVLRRQQEIIDRVGWAVMHVLPADEPGTTNLFIAGVPSEVAHGLLNDLAGRVYDRAGRFTHGRRISDLIAGYDAVLVEGAPIDALRPGVAIARYGRDRVRLQVVWPDWQGRFRWDAGYDFDPTRSAADRSAVARATSTRAGPDARTVRLPAHPQGPDANARRMRRFASALPQRHPTPVAGATGPRARNRPFSSFCPRRGRAGARPHAVELPGVEGHEGHRHR